MNIMLFSFVIILMLSYVSFELTSLRKQVNDLLVQYEGEELASEDDDDLSSEAELQHDLHISTREHDFNERIANIKNELGMQAVPKKPTTTASVFHPDVENLPHESIIDYETNPPDVEYSK